MWIENPTSIQKNKEIAPTGCNGIIQCIRQSFEHILPSAEAKDIQHTSQWARKELKKDIQKAPKKKPIERGSEVDMTKLQTHMKVVNKHSIMGGMLFWGDIDLPKTIQIQPSMDINFYENLDTAWKQKIKKYDHRNGKALKEFYESRVAPYTRDHTSQFHWIPRTQWDAKVYTALQTVQSTVNWDTFFPKDIKKQKLMIELSLSIWVPEMNSIIFAEMIDSFHPQRNDAFFNTIIEKAGEEFLLLYPAMWDPYVSFGPTQLTRKSVASDGGIGMIQKQHMQGSEKLVPSDMMKIRWEHHILGGYIFALYNIRALVSKMNPKQVHILEAKIRSKDPIIKNQLAQYIAAAHNNPTKSRAAFLEWINKNLASEDLAPMIQKSPTARNNAKKAKINHKEQIKKRK